MDSVITTITIAVVATVLLAMWEVNYTAIAQAMSRMYTDNPANDTLQIASYPTISQDSIGAVHFAGEVVNKGNEPAMFVKIIATLYDLNNRVIGTRFTYTDPNTIVAGQAAPFDLSVGFGDNIPVANIDHVKFHVDWTGTGHNGEYN